MNQSGEIMVLCKMRIDTTLYLTPMIVELILKTD